MEGNRLDWEALARIDTLVVLMGVSRLPTITAHLLRHGRAPETPAAVLERDAAGRARPRRHLGGIAEETARANIGAPAILLVGEVVRLRQALAPEILLAAAV